MCGGVVGCNLRGVLATPKSKMAMLQRSPDQAGLYIHIINDANATVNCHCASRGYNAAGQAELVGCALCAVWYTVGCWLRRTG